MMTRRAAPALALALLVPVSILAGCGGPGVPAADVVSTAASAPGPVAAYRLRPGDNLAVKFVTVPELSYSTPVTPSGTVSLPLGGEVQAAGLTVDELAAAISARMADRLVDPTAAVVISTIGKQPVFVIGEVEKPGRIESAGDLTISAALAEAGGILRTGKPSSVMVIRTTGLSEPTAFKVDAGRILSGRDLSQDVVLLPNDVVYVPESVIGKIDNFVYLFFDRIAPAQLFYLRGYDMVNLLEKGWRY